MTEAALARPEPGQFRALFEEHSGYVLHTLARLGVRPGDVEDVAHEVFLTVYQKLTAFDVTRPARPWIFGIAYRHASDYRRLARNRYEVGDGPVETAVACGTRPDEGAEAAETRSLLLRALEALSFEKRAVVIAHDVDGQSIPSLAETIGIPVNTVYSRLRLGRNELRAALARLASPPPSRGGRS